MKNRRVVITGIGAVTPIGIGKDEFWNNCLAGVSGVRRIKTFDVGDYDTKIAATIEDFKPEKYMDKVLLRRCDRFSQFSWVATLLAIEDSRIRHNMPPDRTAVFLGTGVGGMFFCETQIVEIMEKGRKACNPVTIPKITPHAAASQLAISFKAKGPNVTICTACSSGTHAIGQAYDTIRYGKADAAIAGGTESPLMKYNFAAFDALGAMSKRNNEPEHASRPFDKNRDGFVMGEGAAILILESLEHAKKRKADIYAEIIGYSATSGAYHIVAPKTDGSDVIETMKMCLKEAGIQPSDIDYINAHGTATKANDSVETKAIKAVFKKDAYRIPISSTKSMIGHGLGVSGAIEAAVCALSIKTGKIHPTINLETPDPECDLDYVSGKYREKEIKYTLSNSFGFGNNNACLLFGEYE